ncbi:hypothetical protein DAMA08_017130 [Martiniozyma asiatica (nom. inval.)]|nr:hypothetical protein DAMA08_017130 [Martiniozyma asiatica]
MKSFSKTVETEQHQNAENQELHIYDEVFDNNAVADPGSAALVHINRLQMNTMEANENIQVEEIQNARAEEALVTTDVDDRRRDEGPVTNEFF